MTRARGAAIPIAISLAYVAFCLATRPPGPLTSPDSEVYLAFSPIVPTGYPAFLRLLGAGGAVIAQPIIYGAALAWLGLETLLLTESPVLAAAIVGGAILIPDLRAYHASILTESLFMSALVGFLAALMRFIRTHGLPAAAAASTLAGLATTLRSTGYALLPVLVVLALMERRRIAGRATAVFLTATLPMIFLAGGERVTARAVHGDRLISLVGRHLFAKAGLIDAPPAPTRSPDPLRASLEDQLDVAFGPLRVFVGSAPSNLRAVLTLYYESCLQGPCVAELGESRPGSEDPRLAGALAQAGRDRILRAPAGFARLTVTDFTSLWTAYKQRSPDTAPALNAFIAANRPLPFEHAAFRLNRGDAPGFKAYEPVRVLQPVVLALGWLTGALSLWALVAAVRGRPPAAPLAVAGLAALTAQSGLVLSALFAAGIARFIVALWPAIATAALFAVYAVCARYTVITPRS